MPRTTARRPRPFRLTDQDFAPAWDVETRTPPAPAQRREDARRLLNQLRGCYVVTQEPIFIFKAFETAVISRLALPTWVRSELFVMSRNVLHLADEPWVKGRRPIAAAAEALGFVPGGIRVACWKRTNPDEDLAAWVTAWKKTPQTDRRALRSEILGDVALQSFLLKKAGDRNPFTDWRHAIDQLHIAHAVYRHIRDRLPETHAYYLAAKDLGLPVDDKRSLPRTGKPRRAWETYRSVFPIP